MEFDLKRMDLQQLDRAARHYEENGYLLLTGAGSALSNLFEPLLRETMGMDDASFAELLDPTRPMDVLPAEIRKLLARVSTPVDLKTALLDTLKPLLLRLLGPLVHVSSSFHAQVKGGTSRSVDHGGYAKEMEYMEVHGPYLLHQDFAGASIPTTPSMLILWIPLNSTPFWNLRLYPRSHQKGLLCNTWWDLQDPRLAKLGHPLDIQAQKGTAVLFNSLMLHGTSNSGQERRLSCDIRFFPLCGYLPSEFYSLTPNTFDSLRNGLRNAPGPTLQAPLIESLIFLRSETEANNSMMNDVPPLSVLNWCKYVAHVVRGELGQARPYLDRFVNTEIGSDGPDVYAAKFHGHPLCDSTLQAVQEQVASRGTSHG